MKYLLVLFIVGIILISGCIQQKEPSGERMLVETQINPSDSAWSNLQKRPIEYGFIQNNEVNIQFTATKYMSNTNGLMNVEINLPNQFDLVDGNTKWSGNDVSKTLNLKILPREKGRFEIEITATNTKNEFTTKQKIIACVGKDIEELQSYCLQEVQPLPSPEPITEG